MNLQWGSLTNSFSLFRQRVYAALERYLYVGTFIIAIAFALLGLAGISTLVAGSMSAGSQTEHVSIYQAFWRYLLILARMVFGGTARPEDRFVVEQFTNGLLFALTLLAIILSGLYLPSERRKLRKRAPYYEENFSATARTVNSKALPIMKRIYDNAARMRVIAGDYDWVFKDQDIADRIDQMIAEGKATLYSYKSLETVAMKWRDHMQSELYNRIFQAIHFDTPLMMRASLVITAGGTESLIFLTEHNEDNISTAEQRRRYAIFEYHNKGASNAIVKMAQVLFDSIERS